MMSTGSAVATKQFWENVYQVEMENFVDNGHVGEVWFGKACELRMVKWLEERENIIPKHSSILDLGCGNASLLLNLAKRGYSNLTGIDYSDSAIQLAQAKANREKLSQIHFQNLDLMINSENLHNKFDVILDKGTFDVISLREDAEKAVPVYISNVTHYYCRKSNLPRLFFIASCNNTRTELINYFETNFEIMDEEHFSTINFGGKTGTTLTCVIFSLKNSASIYNV